MMSRTYSVVDERGQLATLRERTYANDDRSDLPISRW